MSTINRLSSVDVLQPSDQIPVWDSSNGDTRKASMSTLLAFVESYFADPDYSTRIVAPTTDYFTVDIGATGDSIWMIVNPVLNFTTGTITLPSTAYAVNDQEITVVFTAAVSSFSITSSGATVLGAPISINGYDSFRVRYNASQQTWYTLDTTGDGASTSQIVRQDFTGDGSRTTFTLTSVPSALGNGLQIFIDGVYQERAGYVVSGANIVFSEAPPSLSTIEVLSWQVNDIGVTTANLVTYVPAGTGAVAATVQDALRKRIYITDYSGLVVTQTGPLRGVASTGWLNTSYEDWVFAIQAAFDHANSLGGGEVVLPARSEPYIISDVFYVYSNTTFYCEGEIKLGNSTNGGGIAGTLDGSTNVTVYDLKIDGSGLYTGGSGENAWGFGGSNHKLIGGHIKNCARGGIAPFDGGKGIQNETEFGNIIIEGVAFENCFMAMSTRQEHVLHAYDCGPQLFANITAEDCNILFFVEYAGVGSVPDGKKHSVVLDGFSARNCGSFDGALQFSNAGNVLIANGLIINPTGTTPAFIRGRHRYCRFDNLQFSGNCTNILNNTPGTYCTLTAESEQNHYDFNHIGTISTMMGSSAASDKAITNSTLTARIDTDPSSGLIDVDVKSATTHCVLYFDDKVLRGSSSFISDYYGTFSSVGWAGDVIGNCEEGSWTPTITSTSGTITTVADVVGLYRKVGRSVSLYLTFTISDNGTGAGLISLTTAGLPASVTPPFSGTTGTFTENNVTGFMGFIYHPGAGGNPLYMLKYDNTYPGATNAKFSCVINYTVAS